MRWSEKSEAKGVTCYVRMACGTNEVQTRVNTEVNLVVPLGLLLLAHIRLMLVVNEVDNWSP